MAQVGELVEHPEWGAGRIRAVLDGGRRWRVVFERFPRLPRTVRASLMQAVERPAAPELEFNAPSAVLRQALEALRLGVVPTTGLAALTVARDKELERLRGLLEAPRGMLLFSGSYGSGKTHLMEMAEGMALERNLMVARATFDPVEVPPSHPLRLYRALAEGLRYPDSPGQGLLPLLERLEGRESHVSPQGASFHRYLSPALWALSEHGDHAIVDDLLAFVQGQLPRANQELDRDLRKLGWRGPRLLALPDYRTFGQIMAHLLGGVACWARDAGYHGLLVLVDEAEYLDQLGVSGRELATNVLKYLAMATLGREALAFDPEQVYRGGHPTHRQIRAVFQPAQPMAAICAFTPHPEITRVLQRLVSDEHLILPLEHVPSWELARLAEHIFALYQQAYPDMQAPDDHRRVITGRLTGAFRRGEVESTRQAAKLVVEFWDLYRMEPARALRAVGL